MANAMLRAGRTIACAALLLGAASCCCIDERSHNDSALFLSNVPVEGTLGGHDAVEGEDVRSAPDRYTLNLDGRFTLLRETRRRVAYIGAEVVALDPGRARRHGLEPFTAIQVRSIRRNGPAACAGIRAGDVIAGVDGKPTDNPERLAYLIDQTTPGDSVTVEVHRGDETLSIPLAVGSEEVVERNHLLVRDLPVIDDRDRTGLRFAEITDDVRGYLLGPGATRSGLMVIENLPGGPGFDADVRVRDVIVRIGDRDIARLDDYRAALADLSSGDDATFAILRDGREIEATIELSDNELATGGVNILGIFKHRREPGENSYGVLWNLIFESEAYHSVRKMEDYPQNSTQYRWGCILDLIAWCSTPKKKELRLLWFFPIRVSSE
ncbi:MAG: PDZ domain-containing protein [Planctomycetes bacterium]|nr:PDZ domain-containing protein [Planctomycetota bacterium]